MRPEMPAGFAEVPGILRQMYILHEFVHKFFGGHIGDRREVKVNDSYSYWIQIRSIEKGEDDGSLRLMGY